MRTLVEGDSMVNGQKSKSAAAASGMVHELSVVLPAFNEEANVEAVVRACEIGRAHV